MPMLAWTTIEPLHLLPGDEDAGDQTQQAIVHSLRKMNKAAKPDGSELEFGESTSFNRNSF